ncbi:putative mitogen-activated protein kinase [Paratrimastix pyriformis]|uniref:Mitogen-activated protein kinase n=1 Tax=Paratrimastix pyriformis TaxID=342808 RepID=A0ABQ8UPU1_9EUKA|nr:putative mitogen-activated protein kinase [Paratrimastix pyriformis]
MGASSAPPFLIVSEYLPRGSLFHILHSSTELKPKLIRKMALDAARGMNYLSPPSDLKSLNLLVDNDFTVKARVSPFFARFVADFGTSLLARDNIKVDPVGTVAWAAPEILRGAPPTLKCDVYSFGGIFFFFQTQPGNRNYQAGARHQLEHPRVECVSAPPTSMHSCSHISSIGPQNQTCPAHLINLLEDLKIIIVPPAPRTHAPQVVLWELATRKPPYEGVHPVDLITDILAGSRHLEMPPKPHVLNKLGTACMAADPEQRPSFAEIVRVLDTQLEEETTHGIGVDQLTLLNAPVVTSQGPVGTTLFTSGGSPHSAPLDFGTGVVPCEHDTTRALLRHVDDL